ncbi:ribonuclease HII [bacterium]|nr:ribonuclease HII [bacterium]
MERKVVRKGFQAVAGVDEVGRGALFGSVVAAAIILPLQYITGKCPEWIGEIDDSKVLSPARRLRLAKEIHSQARAVGIGWSTHEEIDRDNISNATLMAMERAVQALAVPPDFLLIDAVSLQGNDCPQMKLSQGDKKCVSIACASIVAKVLRDEMVIRLDRIFDGYSLAKNKGYGTREHYQMLKELGPSPFHRLSFNLKVKGK